MNSYGGTTGVGALGGLVVMLIYGVIWLIAMAIMVLMIIANCKLMSKAGESWWKALIPFYNTWVMFRLISESNVLWFILMFVPLANIVAVCYLLYKTPVAFGMSSGLGVLNIFLGGIITIVAGFSSNTEYVGP